jgi:hypothetical protein
MSSLASASEAAADDAEVYTSDSEQYSWDDECSDDGLDAAAAPTPTIILLDNKGKEYTCRPSDSHLTDDGQLKVGAILFLSKRKKDAVALKGDPYRVHSEIGAGGEGMAVLLQPLEKARLRNMFPAENQPPNTLWLRGSTTARPVVGKLPLAHGVVTAAGCEGLLQEADITSELRHSKHIVQVIGVGYMGMRLKENEPLKPVAFVVMEEGRSVDKIVYDVSTCRKAAAQDT